MPRLILLLLIAASTPAAATDVVVAPAVDTAPATLGDSMVYRSRMLDWNAPDSSPGSIEVAAPLSTMHPTSSYGLRTDPLRGDMRFHAGIDLQGVTGDPVAASADGIVTIAGASRGYGNMVEIDHAGGISTRYAHLSRILISKGDRIARGEVIGLVGSSGRSTGSHLHYEVRFNGLVEDPWSFLGAKIPRTTQVASTPVASRWLGLLPDAAAHLPISQIR